MKQNNIADLPKLFNSAYPNLFNVYKDSNDKYFYNILKSVEFPSDIDSVYFDLYTIKAGDTWPTISYNMYTDVRLWWLICACNNIINPIFNPETGGVVKVLKMDIVKSVLSDISEQ